jgi:hypothetical protein
MAKLFVISIFVILPIDIFHEFKVGSRCVNLWNTSCNLQDIKTAKYLKDNNYI